MRDWWNENNPFGNDNDEPDNDRQQNNQRHNQPDSNPQACEVRPDFYNDSNNNDDDDDDDYIFRGDSRSPAEIFADGGFQPWNLDGSLSLSEHVYGRDDVTGETIDLKTEDQWVSASTDEQSAAPFGIEDQDLDGNVIGDAAYVYRIRQPPNSHNVQEELGISPDGAYGEDEVAVEGGIPAQYIESYRRVTGEGIGEFILGPRVKFPGSL